MVHTKGGVIFDSHCVTGIPLLSGEDNYKYLGILECDKILMNKVKEAVQKEYLSRLNAILKSSVSDKNTITSISAYAIPVLWYGLGVLHRTQAELRGLDMMTRKATAKEKIHHEHSDVHRLYLNIRDRGRGLVGVVDTQRQECTDLVQYMEGSEDPLVQMVKASEGQRVHGMMPWSRAANKGGTTNEINKYHKRTLDNMKMHGQFSRQQSKIAPVDIEV